jgi:Mannosyl-glycoprotein endo-beta-N-acetylglucosaminidase.
MPNPTNPQKQHTLGRTQAATSPEQTVSSARSSYTRTKPQTGTPLEPYQPSEPTTQQARLTARPYNARPQVRQTGSLRADAPQTRRNTAQLRESVASYRADEPPMQSRSAETRPLARPYQEPKRANNEVLRRFVDDSPVGWLHFFAQRIAFVIHPFFAVVIFIANLVLQFFWAVVQFVSPLVVSPASQRRIQRMPGPMLHENSPWAVTLFVTVLIALSASISQPFLFPEPAEPRAFSYSTRPAWQRIANPQHILNSAWGAMSALSNVVSSVTSGSEEDTSIPVALQPLGQRAPGDHHIQGAPSISPDQIDRILQSYGSPATGTGQIWYDLGLKYNIDPAYAIAFFIHESSAGTNPAWAGWKDYGSGANTHNVGNIICAGYATCFGRFRDYPNWEAGIEDWYRLIAVEYIEGRGTVTVEQIIPIYAPSFENDVQAYVNAVERLVDTWRLEGVP